MEAPVEWHPKMFNGQRAELANQPVRPKRLNILWHAQRGYCYLCGQKMGCTKRMRPNYRSFDHVIPRALGGKSELLNLALACKACNCARRTAALTPEQQIRLYDTYRKLGRVASHIRKGKSLELINFQCPPPWKTMDRAG